MIFINIHLPVQDDSASMIETMTIRDIRKRVNLQPDQDSRIKYILRLKTWPMVNKTIKGVRHIVGAVCTAVFSCIWINFCNKLYYLFNKAMGL